MPVSPIKQSDNEMLAPHAADYSMPSDEAAIMSMSIAVFGSYGHAYRASGPVFSMLTTAATVAHTQRYRFAGFTFYFAYFTFSLAADDDVEKMTFRHQQRISHAVAHAFIFSRDAGYFQGDDGTTLLMPHATPTIV